jgi:hypothetical protein
MSLFKVEAKISDFLSTNTPEVMAIKGAWGVGKTFTWNKLSKQAKDNKQIALKKYSYVSLFGINSLEAFKAAIFENLISTDLIGTVANIDTLKNNYSNEGLISVGKKGWSILGEASFFKGFSSAINSFSFLTIKETIICIDDLERRGNNLQIKDVLGLISLLKEQRNCKIVILVNDGEIGVEDYVKYREKVIDLEIEFAPTSSECALIAFDSKWNAYEATKECSTKLNIKNIRLLKKIEKLVSEAEKYWLGKEPEIRQQFVSSLTLFAFSHYEQSNSKSAPPLDFILNYGYDAWGFGLDENEGAEKKKWRSYLFDYGYQHTDELDLKIGDAVIKGYFDDEEIKKLADNQNALILANKSTNSFSAAWNLFHDTFANNEDELVETLLNSLIVNAKNIAPNNLNGTVSLFRELGRDDEATRAIDEYITARNQESEIFNLSNNHFFGDKIDPEIIDKFNNQFFQNEKKETAKEVLLRISGQNGWNQKDIEILANTCADDYYNIFTSEVGDHLHRIVKKCLEFGQFSNADDKQNSIARNARDALIRIGKESNVNKRRVKRYGVNLD